ncbi:MAG: signal peptidase I [Deltaproteobacteria bacterium]
MGEDTDKTKDAVDDYMKKAKDAGAKDAGKKHVREMVEAVVIAFLLALFIRTFVMQAFKIPSGSMEDTLLIGDHIIVSKFSYGVQAPRPAMIKLLGARVPFFETQLKNVWGGVQRGDVIVFRFPGDRSKDYIKRVVGIPRDTVELKNRVVYINGIEQKEDHAYWKGTMFGEDPEKSANFGPYVVPEATVFVMGDNRDRSFDSRFWGAVPMADIKGRALIIYWSWDKDDRWVRVGRFAKIIH